MIDINKIGPIVATPFGYSTYFGDTVTVWAKFDTDPRKIAIACMRMHLVDAIDIENEKLDGYIKVTAYYNEMQKRIDNAPPQTL